MKRGEFYLVKKPGARDPKKQRVFVVVSRATLIESRFSSVICAPVYTARDGISTQVPVGANEGLKSDCSIHCDELVSLPPRGPAGRPCWPARCRKRGQRPATSARR
ncbi:MAG: type II toxin-antitoxin system PemK/MazF family toxin [Acidobacteria bacterium]|nr:type II toxin-antitoxin system PemK/MazF family toxin [Acidobacteriota bacterium]